MRFKALGEPISEGFIVPASRQGGRAKHTVCARYGTCRKETQVYARPAVMLADVRGRNGNSGKL